MARWQDLGTLGAAPDAADTMLVLDTSDTSANASGTVKQVTVSNLITHTHELTDITDAGALAALDDITPSEINSTAYASQAEAEAGTENTKISTPLRVFQAIAAWVTANAAALLTALKTVDGTGSGLDADTLDGTEGADFARTSSISAVGISNDYNDLDNQPTVTASFLSPEDVTDAVHFPASGDRYYYAPSAGSAIAILQTDFDSPGLAQLEYVSGTVRVIPGVGVTINGSNRVAATDAVSDAVFTGQSGATVSITSAGADLTAYAVGDIIVVSGHDAEATNNGIYLVESATTSQADLTKIANADGAVPIDNPVDASSEAISIDLLDPVNLVSLASIWRKSGNFEMLGGTDEDKNFDGSDVLGIANAALTGAVSGNGAMVVTRGAGSDQPTVADSGAWITSDGAITIPNGAVGDGWFHCTLEFGGDHDVTFNSITWNTGSASGDIVSVIVKSASTIRITPLILAADVITEADFT